MYGLLQEIALSSFSLLNIMKIVEGVFSIKVQISQDITLCQLLLTFLRIAVPSSFIH